MGIILGPMLVLFGICSYVCLNPKYFLLGDNPDYISGYGGIFFCIIILLFWIYSSGYNDRFEDDVDETSDINIHLMDLELNRDKEYVYSTVNNRYERNSGIRKLTLAGKIKLEDIFREENYQYNSEGDFDYV